MPRMAVKLGCPCGQSIGYKRPPIRVRLKIPFAFIVCTQLVLGKAFKKHPPHLSRLAFHQGSYKFSWVTLGNSWAESNAQIRQCVH